MASSIIVALLFLSLLLFAFAFQPAKAQSGTIYINPDGSISPSTAPITNVNNDKYTFTGNIYDSIIVERGDITIDGNGHTVQGPGSGFGDGIFLSSVNNVTILNTDVTGFVCGMYLYSFGTIVSGNNLTGNYAGVGLCNSNNLLSSNSITGNTVGISSNSSFSNVVVGNSIAEDHYGIVFAYCSGNLLYHNDFVNNTQQTLLYGSAENSWDNGYPSGGNYWSDYQTRYPSATEIDSSGIWNTPYVISSNNTDHFSLIHPYGSIRDLNTSLTYLTIQSAINGASAGDTIYVKAGTYKGPQVTISKPLQLIGENRSTTIIDGNGSWVCLYVQSTNNVNITGFTIQDGYGIYLWDSENVNVSGNIISGNGQGIVIGGSAHNTVSKNIVTLNGAMSVYLSGSNNNEISKNVVTLNNGDAIWLDNSYGNAIVENNVSRNGLGTSQGYHAWGIRLDWSSNNIIYHNNIIDNYEQAFTWGSSANNSWDNGYPSGGNYWSDYQTAYPSAIEIDSSGIWNTPYVIDANNTDSYPLMEPYSALSLSLSILPNSATLDVDQVKLFNSSIFLGTAPYRYEWYLNGVPVSGATHSTWNFSEPVGSYDVYLNLTDSTGTTAKSNVAHVTVSPPLSVTTSPPSASIFVGQSILITSTVTGGASPYGYQWYLNGNTVAGATNVSLTFTPISTGTYYVYLNVTDSTGATAKSNVAEITVAKVAPVGGVSASVTAFSFLAPWLSTVSLLTTAILLKGIITKKRKKD